MRSNGKEGKSKIIELYLLGFNYSSIQRLTKMSYVTVFNTCKEYRNKYGEPSFFPLTEDKKTIIKEILKDDSKNFRLILLAKITGCKAEEIIEYLYDLFLEGHPGFEFIKEEMY